MRIRSNRGIVLAWTAVWSSVAVAAGTLNVNADVPHLPRQLGPILFGVTGALAGLLSSLIFLLLRCLPGGSARPAGVRTVAFAAAAGALAMLVLARVIGVPRLTACIAGVGAGALSGLLTSDPLAVRRNSR